MSSIAQRRSMQYRIVEPPWSPVQIGKHRTGLHSVAAQRTVGPRSVAIQIGEYRTALHSIGRRSSTCKDLVRHRSASYGVVLPRRASYSVLQHHAASQSASWHCRDLFALHNNTRLTHPTDSQTTRQPRRAWYGIAHRSEISPWHRTASWSPSNSSLPQQHHLALLQHRRHRLLHRQTRSHRTSTHHTATDPARRPHKALGGSGLHTDDATITPGIRDRSHSTSWTIQAGRAQPAPVRSRVSWLIHSNVQFDSCCPIPPLSF